MSRNRIIAATVLTALTVEAGVARAQQAPHDKSTMQIFWENLVEGIGKKTGEYAFDQLRAAIESQSSSRSPSAPEQNYVVPQQQAQNNTVQPSGPTASPGNPGWSAVNNQTCYVWNEIPEPQETARWTGACLNNKISGQGRLLWSSGYTYIGEYKFGRATGFAEFIWPRGDRYIGNFTNGFFDGYGVKVWSSGNRFEGEWHSFKPNGYGVLTTSRGQYSGNWVNGCLTGSIRQAVDRQLSSCP